MATRFIKYCMMLAAMTIAVNSTAQTSLKSKKTNAPLQLGKFSVSSFDSIVTTKCLTGSIVYINFWFATCPPCIAEMSALNKLYKKLKKDNRFKFLSLTFESQEMVKTIVDKYEIAYPIFYLSKEDMNRLKYGKGYPTSIIVDSDGLIIYTKTGGSSNEKEARKIVMKEIYPNIQKALNTLR